MCVYLFFTYRCKSEYTHLLTAKKKKALYYFSQSFDPLYTVLWKIISSKCGTTGFQAFSYTRPGKFGNINIFTLINEKLDFVFIQVTSNITFVWLFENKKNKKNKSERRLILLHSTTHVKMHAYLSIYAYCRFTSLVYPTGTGSRSTSETQH